MILTFASYNIRKAIGTDRRRNPERILAVLHEIDADVVALQEVDRRFGTRMSALPLQAIHDLTPYQPVPVATRQGSLGWHGNALLVRRGIEIAEAAVVELPTLEPRGAIRADLILAGVCFRVVGMHLDLSGIRRRQQVRSVLAHVAGCSVPCPSVLLGDFNDWARHGGCFREFGEDWRVLAPGRSFPSRRPVAQLDRIVISSDWEERGAWVHHSALSARASDHLPVWTELRLPKF